MKRKIAIVCGIVLVLAVITAVWAVPVFAADPSGSTPPASQGTQQGNRIRAVVRLLLVQDEAKVDSLIAQAKDAGKITDEQAVKIKQFWTDHHKQFTRKVIITRLLWANDGTKVQAFLDKGVASGKITSAQAEKLMTLWTSLHTK